MVHQHFSYIIMCWKLVAWPTMPILPTWINRWKPSQGSSNQAWVKYDISKNIFVNSYPWLFPGGICDMYDIEHVKVSIQDCEKLLLWYYDGRFLKDSLCGLFLYNTIQRHASNREGNFFLDLDRFIGRNPPTVQELQRQLELKNTWYINMLRYSARNIKGSDNYWHARTNDLEQWNNHHVGKGHGPPTFFITLSCAKIGGQTYDAYFTKLN